MPVTRTEKFAEQLMLQPEEVLVLFLLRLVRIRDRTGRAVLAHEVRAARAEIHLARLVQPVVVEVVPEVDASSCSQTDRPGSSD